MALIGPPFKGPYNYHFDCRLILFQLRNCDREPLLRPSYLGFRLNTLKTP